MLWLAQPRAPLHPRDTGYEGGEGKWGVHFIWIKWIQNGKEEFLQNQVTIVLPVKKSWIRGNGQGPNRVWTECGENAERPEMICLQAGKTAHIISSTGNMGVITGLGQKIQLSLADPEFRQTHMVQWLIGWSQCQAGWSVMGWGGARLPSVSDLGTLSDSAGGCVKRKRSRLAAGGEPR